MKYVIDSDIISYFIDGDEWLTYKFTNYSDNDIYTTRMNYAEILFGIYKSGVKTKKFEILKGFIEEINILEFDEESAKIYAVNKSRLRKKGEIVADMDLMIASITIANSYTLITNNVKHFQRFEGLKIENWIK